MVSDGTRSARELTQAFKTAAEAAIAANKGVAPAWVEGAAALRGYKIATDEAGKSTLVLADATDKTSGAHRRAAGAIGEHMTALEKLNAARERDIASQEKANALAERELALYREKWNIDKDGFTRDANGQRQQMSVPNGDFVFQAAKGAGLSEAEALALMDKYFKNGKPSGVAERNGLNGPSRDWFSIVNEAISKTVIEKARQNATQGTASTNTSASPGLTTAPQQSTGQSERGVTYINNITIQGVGSASTRHKDEQSAMTEVDFIRKLVMAKSASQ